jgi:hypothetical protein
VATNFYLHNFPAGQITQEQLLVEDLVIEALQWSGMDVFYLPRAGDEERDFLFGDDSLKVYNRAYPIEMYLENVTGMDGEGDFISKFGLEIRDELSMLVSRRRFKLATDDLQYAVDGVQLSRPREGDLVYIPLVQNFFEITFVEHENDQAMFYTLGRGRGGNVYVYALKLKQFVFSNEIVQTGNFEIDQQIRDHYQKTKIVLNSGSGEYEEDEIVYQGTDLANATAQAFVYDYSLGGDLFVYNVRGKFITAPLIGVTSNASYIINVASDFVTLDNPFEDIIDNNRIQEEGLNFIDWSEKNPFGES